MVDQPIDVSKVGEWLLRHWKKPWLCPVCGHEEWNMAEGFSELRQFAHGNLRLGGQLVPLVVLTCNTCGYMMLLNAISMGLVTPPERRPEEESAHERQ